MFMLHGMMTLLLATMISSLQQVTIMVRALVHPINLSNNTGNSVNPQIATSGNNVYVTWHDDTPAGNSDIFFAVSNNNGTSFGNPINLSNNAGVSSFPQIAAIGNNVYVTWHDNTPAGNFDILFASSNNNGTSFGTPINLSNNIGNSDTANSSNRQQRLCYME